MSGILEFAGIIVTAVCMLITQVIISFKSNNITNVKIDAKFESIKSNMDYMRNEREDQIGNLRADIKNRTDEIKEKITKLELKQDKHNHLVERVALAEQSIKSAHHRLDDIGRK